MPEVEYLNLLGCAAYAWAYTEWMLIYAMKWGGGDDLSKLAGGTGGQILTRFSRFVNGASDELVGIVSARAAAKELKRLNHRRNDILHARPATINGLQRLNRWAPETSGASQGVIESADLERFVLDLEAVRDSLVSLFEALRPR